MKSTLRPFLTSFALLVALICSSVAFAADGTAAASAPTAAKIPTFLIVMRLTPKYHAEDAWTDQDNRTVGAHFKRLQEAAAQGHVILAGRTQVPLAQTFGLVVLSAADEAAAKKFMTEDPCVVAGIMTAELHPYEVAILRKS